MPDDGQGGAKYFERSNLKGTGGDDPAGWFCTNGLILLAAPSYQLTGDYQGEAGLGGGHWANKAVFTSSETIPSTLLVHPCELKP